ncbi:uncharacterized protein PV07_10873 [Cladophialophora immunda]|uniref:Uncharacterized protein n=1 Tax=Cladophialophora immunda TaxID=569365 RepID=A0A0D2BW16_9EURO|nr:uncharacterized protein PV07_10873 [Cladophialophora immunda]KIW22590.1 hypothetical protein PV07_10873 [Cladophialophora immunda]
MIRMHRHRAKACLAAQQQTCKQARSNSCQSSCGGSLQIDTHKLATAMRWEKKPIALFPPKMLKNSFQRPRTQTIRRQKWSIRSRCWLFHTEGLCAVSFAVEAFALGIMSPHLLIVKCPLYGLVFSGNSFLGRFDQTGQMLHQPYPVTIAATTLVGQFVSLGRKFRNHSFHKTQTGPRNLEHSLFSHALPIFSLSSALLCITFRRPRKGILQFIVISSTTAGITASLLVRDHPSSRTHLPQKVQIDTIHDQRDD